MTTATAALVLAQSAGTASGPRLIAAALIGIVLIVVLITRFKVHPFLGLTIGSLVVGAIAGLPIAKTIDSFGKGFGDTAASIGTLIALGAMFGKLLADSGGADEIVDTIVGHSSTRTLPWAMALVGALIGLPMFFEIGLVLLMRGGPGSPSFGWVRNRVKSPTAATIDNPTVASIPGTVINRNTSGRASATCPRSVSINRSSWPWKSS
jgi:hypothetical protein